MFHDQLTIQSHKGPYVAWFVDSIDDALADINLASAHFIVDERVLRLHGTALAPIAQAVSVLKLQATEDAKNLNCISGYVSHLVGHGLRRDQTLVAIGGGIIQDITCFLAATILRGVPWRFIPTTLLAQADSCIGSKSSINADAAKNILGTFTPPQEVRICTRFLDTLDEVEIRSGIGEILKVHAIEGVQSFVALAEDYPRLASDRALLRRYIRRALEIKKPYIEADEFDRGIRNIFNYGHSFGHALEAATDFAIPHGIGVTMGMDMANYVAKRCYNRGAAFDRMHATLKENYRNFEHHPVPLDRFLTSIAKDKKNFGASLMLILPDEDDHLAKISRVADEAFVQACSDFLNQARVSL